MNTISKQEKTMVAFKAGKMHVTLTLEIFKLQPLLINNSANPRELKGIYKMALPILYDYNKKAWVTARVNYDFMKPYVGPVISEFNKSNNLDDKALLLVDNAPAHGKDMANVMLKHQGGISAS